MIVVTAVDNNNGLLFNHRRVSRDRVLRGRILEIAGNSRLLMDEFSSKQFRESLPSTVIIAEDFLEKALPGDYVFLEDKPLLPYAGRIEAMYLYHWNRDYPSDFRFYTITGQRLRAHPHPGFRRIFTRGYYRRILGESRWCAG